MGDAIRIIVILEPFGSKPPSMWSSIAPTQKDEESSKKREASQKSNIEKMKDFPVRTRIKRKVTRVALDNQEEIQGILLKTCEP